MAPTAIGFEIWRRLRHLQQIAGNPELLAADRRSQFLGVGVFIAACTYLISYTMQPSFIADRARARQDHMRKICMTMIFCSLTLFLGGMALTANAVFPGVRETAV